MRVPSSEESGAPGAQPGGGEAVAGRELLGQPSQILVHTLQHRHELPSDRPRRAHDHGLAAQDTVGVDLDEPEPVKCHVAGPERR